MWATVRPRIPAIIHAHISGLSASSGTDWLHAHEIFSNGHYPDLEWNGKPFVFRDKINAPKYYTYFYIKNSGKYFICKVKPNYLGLIGRSTLISKKPELENVRKMVLNVQRPTVTSNKSTMQQWLVLGYLLRRTNINNLNQPINCPFTLIKYILLATLLV